MAEQGKQMRVVARKGFSSYHSIELVFLVDGNRYVVDPNTLFSSGKAIKASLFLPV
jgi:hypothetical protein